MNRELDLKYLDTLLVTAGYMAENDTRPRGEIFVNSHIYKVLTEYLPERAHFFKEVETDPCVLGRRLSSKPTLLEYATIKIFQSTHLLGRFAKAVLERSENMLTREEVLMQFDALMFAYGYLRLGDKKPELPLYVNTEVYQKLIGHFPERAAFFKEVNEMPSWVIEDDNPLVTAAMRYHFETSVQLSEQLIAAGEAIKNQDYSAFLDAIAKHQRAVEGGLIVHMPPLGRQFELDDCMEFKDGLQYIATGTGDAFVFLDGGVQRFHATARDVSELIYDDMIQFHCELSYASNIGEQKKDRYASPYGRKQIKKKSVQPSGLLARLVRKTQ